MAATTPQLCLIRCMLKAGISASLLEIFWNRCGATPAEWEALAAAGLVEQDKKDKRWNLTAAGRKYYRREKVGRYF